MNRQVYLALIMLVACSTATKFKDCGSKKGEVTSVDVSGCPDAADTCDLVRGSKPAITINFQSKTDSTKVTAVVHGVIDSIPLPFPIPQPDGCKSGLSCPLTNGQSYSYSNAINVRRSYPPLAVTVKYELRDDSNSDIVCVNIPSHIK